MVINRAVGDGRRSGKILVEIIDCKNLEFRTGLHDGDNPVTCRDINFPVGIHRRGAVSLPMCPTLIMFFSRFRIVAREISRSGIIKIHQPVVNQRVRDIRRSGPKRPEMGLFHIGNVTLKIGSATEKRCGGAAG